MKKIFVILVSVLALCSSLTSFAKGGYVRLYEHSGFHGRSVTLYFKQNAPDMHAYGFNDKASSVQYSIPAGWMVTLHADTGYRGSKYDIVQSGSAVLGSFGDKCSSVEWHQR